MRNIKLSEISMYNKFQLALKAGYNGYEELGVVMA
jgi:hypothetical protein